MARFVMPLTATNLLMVFSLHDIALGLVQMVAPTSTPGASVLAGVLMILFMVACKQLRVWRTGDCAPLVTTQAQ